MLSFVPPSGASATAIRPLTSPLSTTPSMPLCCGAARRLCTMTESPTAMAESPCCAVTGGSAAPSADSATMRAAMLSLSSSALISSPTSARSRCERCSSVARFMCAHAPSESSAGCVSVRFGRLSCGLPNKWRCRRSALSARSYTRRPRSKRPSWPAIAA
eukprot:scaffold12080_cov67-Phaeocystis_antarctica.AAC.14